MEEQVSQDPRWLSTYVAEGFSGMLHMYSRRVKDEWRKWEPGGIHQRDPNKSQWGSQVRKSFYLICHYGELKKNCICKDVEFQQVYELPFPFAIYEYYLLCVPSY